jgi:antitoxin HicB
MAAVQRKAPVKKAKAKAKAKVKRYGAGKHVPKTKAIAKAKKPNPAIGGGFDDFLAEEGILNKVSAEAAKRVIAWQLQQAMEVQHISKAELARSLHTSRGALDRILDPDNTGLTLKSLGAIADFLGKRLEINLVDS